MPESISPNNLEPPQLLRLGQVLKLLNVSRATLYRMMDCNGFPRGTRLRHGPLVWRAEVVHRWIRARFPDPAELPKGGRS